MPTAQKIPATIITGFLGAGKTTTIRHLLETANGRRLAFIINEFGDLGIDGEIIKSCGIEGCDEDDVVELANGCICCTVADDFLPTMQALLDRPQPPDHIIIETSGLALPKPLIKAFNWPEVRSRVTVDGVIAVVDGPAVAEGRFADDPDAVNEQRAADEMLDHESPLEELFEEQLAAADLVVLNKTDLLDPPARESVTATIHKEMRHMAKSVAARHGRIDAEILLGLGAAAEDDLDTRPSHHDDGSEHDHDDFVSFDVDLDPDREPETLVRRLAPAIAAHDILRIKGFAAIAGKDMRLVVQAVGPRIQHYFDRPWRADEPRRTRLVVIGESGLDRDAVAAALKG
ncbi:MAG: cobalamin biosynthesis protein CobW [Alphaproteobacteria bacterium]|nr:cobalamin biosynthesis protein CobW [Alphaproteobacteria bacterium]